MLHCEFDDRIFGWIRKDAVKSLIEREKRCVCERFDWNERATQRTKTVHLNLDLDLSFRCQ